MMAKTKKAPATGISTARIVLKRTLKLILGAATLPVLAWRKSEGVRVLHYHRVNPYPFAQLGPVSREITVVPAAFENQLAWLKKAGYRSARPQEFEEVLAGRAADPKTILITFDDGFEDNYLWAHQLLLKYGFQGVFFITTDYVGAEQGPAWTIGDAPGFGRFLRWEQIRQMQEEGALIASHTCTHRVLTSLSDEELACELKTSRSILAEQLGGEVRWFAYPAGDEDLRTRAATQNAGYSTAFTTASGISNATSSRMAVPRSEISASDSMLVFRMKLAGLLDWTRFKESAGFRRFMGGINKFLIRRIVRS